MAVHRPEGCHDVALTRVALANDDVTKILIYLFQLQCIMGRRSFLLCVIIKLLRQYPVEVEKVAPSLLSAVYATFFRFVFLVIPFLLKE